MADLLKTTNLMKARKYLQEVSEFNKGRELGQYNYIYIAQLRDGYMVRLSQNKPTARKAKYITRLNPLATSHKWTEIERNVWQGPKGDNRFVIEVFPKKMLYKTVWVVRLSGFTNKELADFDTEKEAIAFAKKWMSEH